MPDEEQAEQAAAQEDVKEEVGAEVPANPEGTSAQEEPEKQADAVSGEENANQPESQPEEVDYKALYEAEKTRRIQERTRLKRKLETRDETSRTEHQTQQKPAETQADANKDAGLTEDGDLTDEEKAKLNWDPAKIAREVVRRELKAERMQAQKEESQRKLNERLSDFDQKAADYAAKNPDYDKLISEREDGYGDGVIEVAVLNSGPELDHYLSLPENEAEVERVKAIQDPTDKAIEVGALREKAKAWAARRKGSQKTITNAPAPVPSVGGKGGNVASDWRYDSKLSPAEYRAKMLAES